MERLKRRTDFRAIAEAGARAPAKAFVLQALRREEQGQEQDQVSGAVRVGFTVSRQVGNAVERNRVRRRLREMVRLKAKTAFTPGYDYVLVGRRTALMPDASGRASPPRACLCHAIEQTGPARRSQW